MTPANPVFPKRLLAFAFLFSVFATILSSALPWQMHLHENESAEKHVALTQNIGRIMLLDESIAMSARMAAVSGDAAYEQRYDRLIKQLTQEIATLGSVLPQADMASFVAETDASSLAMGKMEQQAFAFFHQGKRQEAMALLNGAEYMRLEKVYADGMGKTWQAASVLLAHEGRNLHLLAAGLSLLGAVSAAILLAAWLLALRAIRRWQAERKQAEETVRVSEERMRGLVEGVQAGVVVHDAQTRILFCNPAARKLLGYSDQDLVGTSNSDPKWSFVRADGSPMPVAEYPANRVLATRQPLREVVGGIHTNTPDVTKWVLINADPVFDAQGQISQVIVAFMDITERKRAEQEILALSELKHRLLFENSRDALMTLAPPTWQFTSANNAAVQLFGAASEAEVTVLGPWDVSPERQPDGSLSGEKGQEMVAIALRDGSHFFEWEHQRLDGSTFAADVLLTRVQIEGEAFLQATVRDITERQRATRELALVNFAMNHVKEAAYLADEQGRFHYVNDEACRVMGYSRDELLNLRVIDIDAVESRQEQWTANWEMLKIRKSATFESRHINRDGSELPVEISANS